MTGFKVGDRVRVRNLPDVGEYAGRKGEVIQVSRSPAGVVYAYHVRLDVGTGRAPGEIRIVLAPHELDPVDTP